MTYSSKLPFGGVAGSASQKPASGEAQRHEEKQVDYFMAGALVWLAIFLLLGLVKGFWRSLAAATSLVSAYFTSVYFAPPLSDFLMGHFESVKFGRTVWWMISAAAIFLLVSLIARLIVLGVGKSLPVTSRFFDRLGGAIVSLGYGALLGAVLLWGLAFVVDSWNLRQERNGREIDPRMDTSSPAVTWSRRIMSQWVNWNVRQSGGSEALAGMSAAIVESPAKVMADMQATVQSPEFKTMVQSENVQGIIARKDAEALRRSSEFQQLMRQPALQELRQSIAAESSGWTDEKIAYEMVDIWTKVERMKNRPEVNRLLDDPEIQDFLKGGKITPSLVTKGQQLLALLREDPSALKDVQVPQMYQWHDDHGELHVTDERHVPANKRSTAKPIDLNSTY